MLPPGRAGRSAKFPTRALFVVREVGPDLECRVALLKPRRVDTAARAGLSSSTALPEDTPIRSN